VGFDQALAGPAKDASASLEDALVKYEDASPLARKKMEPDIYNKIISWRKNSKSLDPDEKAGIDRKIAQYSNSLVKRQ
jgi:hypothetical protein